MDLVFKDFIIYLSMAISDKDRRKLIRFVICLSQRL